MVVVGGDVVVVGVVVGDVAVVVVDEVDRLSERDAWSWSWSWSWVGDVVGDVDHAPAA